MNTRPQAETRKSLGSIFGSEKTDLRRPIEIALRPWFIGVFTLGCLLLSLSSAAPFLLCAEVPSSSFHSTESPCPQQEPAATLVRVSVKSQIESGESGGSIHGPDKTKSLGPHPSRMLKNPSNLSFRGAAGDEESRKSFVSREGFLPFAPLWVGMTTFTKVLQHPARIGRRT